MRLKEIDLSIGYLGLQVAFGIQSASLSRIFQGLGATVDQLALLWLAGPVTGLLIQPIIGMVSDRYPTRFGRRRPYIVIATLVVVGALSGLTVAPTLGLAVTAIWLLEAGMNALHAPYRALVADQLPPERHAQGYAVQTVFIGLGALAGALAPSLLASIGLSNMAQPGLTAPSIRIGFLVAALAVVLTVGWTVLRVREAGTDAATTPVIRPLSDWRRGCLEMGWMLRGIGLVQFCCWFGLYQIWVYATPAIATHVYGSSTPFDEAYGRGADFVGVLFATYNGVAGVCAFLLPALFRRFGVASIHAVALGLGALGLCGLALSGSPMLLVGCAILIGIAYASMLNAPFLLGGTIVPSGTAGTFMGVMNIFIVAPQLLAGVTMGWVVENILDGSARLALPLAGAAMLAGALISLRLRMLDKKTNRL